MLKFIEPHSLQAPIFFQQWKQIENSPLSEQSIIKSSRAIDMQWLSKVISSGFKLHVLQGVDPNINNLVAAGNVHARDGDQGYITVLLRIESNAQAQMYRATVRSNNANVTAALRDLLVLELS